MLEGDAEQLSRKAVELALAGDTVALKLCLDRILPLRKGAPVVFPLPKIERATDLPAAVSSVTEAVANGELSPEEGASVTVVLEAQRREFKLADHEARLQAHNSRLAALERATRVTQEGHVIVIRGGMPDADPTAEEIADAVVEG